MLKWDNIKGKYKKRIAEVFGEEELLIVDIINKMIYKRNLMNLTQEELSNRSGVNVKKIEDFKSELTTRDMLKLFKVLEMSFKVE